MQSYINESIKTFGGDVSGGVTSPETSRLLDVTEGAEKFLEEKFATFKSKMAKLLWVMKKSRPEIKTAISFLCT